MNTETIFDNRTDAFNQKHPKAIFKKNKPPLVSLKSLPEVLFISSYPPRECGIATYSQDLLKALRNKFSQSFSLKVCALEAGKMENIYPSEVKYVFDTHNLSKYTKLAYTINHDDNIKVVLLQHEFGFFQADAKKALLQFLYSLTKPVVVVFHTVLPNPNEDEKVNIRNIAAACSSIIVMTKNAAQLLQNDYTVSDEKIKVIAHGTHLVPYLDKALLKEKYGLQGKKILSTFGLLSSGKSIETTLDAMPEIISQNPDAMFLVIGKTHPSVVKFDGEVYRDMLEEKVKFLGLENHVKFVNHYLPLNDLLEFLQLTDIYLFTSKDPNQAVSGTFSYAMSCGCSIISTPIPHARELLKNDAGVFIDFQNSAQLAVAANQLMSDDALRNELKSNNLQQILPTAWENSAISHAFLLQKVVADFNGVDKSSAQNIALQYRLPTINLHHLKKMTTEVGIIQFAKINQPDIETGYTLDDNARALIAICMHYEKERVEDDLKLIHTYLNFIEFCQQSDGSFLNYVDFEEKFTTQNYETNLSDSNGRAIWALGFLISKSAFLPKALIQKAKKIMEKGLSSATLMFSPRAMSFTIKGLYYSNLEKKSITYSAIIKLLSDRLVAMYRHEKEQNWHWFEPYLTYGNSILPEAMLCAWLDTGNLSYKEVAKESFDFLLSLTFSENKIKVISNKGWLHKGHEAVPIVVGGEQPIDVAYTILAMGKFYEVFKDKSYFHKKGIAFNWFLGNNHLQQIIYNPCTGGCFDGLEEHSVNLNQGAESTVSYLMARLTM
jgi:glycosyltransferase involved in cell wall biosynthesis